LQQAIAAKVAAMARNRYKDGKLKAGMSLAEDFDALTAETHRSGEALALRRDAKASFEAYLQGLNKSATTVQILGTLFYESSKVLNSAGEKYVAALTQHVMAWIGTLKDEQKTRFAPKLAELQDSINAASSPVDLD